MRIATGDFCRTIEASPFAARAGEPPWAILAELPALLSAMIAALDGGWTIVDGIARHRTATIEPGAVVKPPAILGPGVFVAAGAYLRGGVFLDEGCIVGPGAELKTGVLFNGAKLAHFNFVGDSVVGAEVNCEAGAIVANHRNERAEKRIRIAFEGSLVDTGVEKFGALIGDGVRLGANAVLSPGTLLRPGTVVPRLGLVDQAPAA